MSTLLFRRPPRRNGPELPHGELNLQEPPVIPEVQRGGMRMLLMLLPMALMSGVMVLMFTRSSGTSSWLMGGMMMVAMVAMMGGQMLGGSGDRTQRMAGDRRDYLRYLSQQRRRIRQVAAKQRDALDWRHPDPASLWSLAMTSRRWERRPAHPDFGEVRIGTGEQRLAVRIAPMQTKPIEDLEPLAAKSLRRFIKAYGTLAAQPVALYVRGFAQIRLTGDLDLARGMLRALLAQLVTFHPPEELVVAACVGGDAAERWDWLKWLPHSQSAQAQDAAGAARLVTDSIDELITLLGEGFVARARYESDAVPSRDEPYVVVLCDGGRIPPNHRAIAAGYRNMVLLDVGGPAVPPSKQILRIDAADGDLTIVKVDRVGREIRTPLAHADWFGTVAARSLARLLSPYRLSVSTEVTADALATDFDLATLLNVDDLGRLDLTTLWGGRGAADRLRVPIGVGADGLPIDLDLKEPAQGGSGPHGLLIGATGSGKSELLRTLVLALTMTHSSETLNMVLVDFKGGATFLGLDRLPHVSAVITNLSEEAALVSRMRDALHGELVRRQELLRKAGNYSSALDYERARAQGTALDPLPSLVVVVDEFSELLAAHHEFVELFVMIGRLGRSLGVHLLLASQRLDDGRIGQLESHLSYRIGLRTFSATESRSVIGVPDAYELPPAPGNGYLRLDVSTLVRFKAAYVSGPYRPRSARIAQDVVRRQVVPYVTQHVPHRGPTSATGAADAAEPTLSAEPVAAQDPKRSILDVVVDQLVGAGPPAHQVWLPPLATSPTLDLLLPGLSPDPELGLHAPDWPGNGALVTPVGFVDRPFEQLRELFTVDLAGVGGHLGITGGPQSGKSTLLRTLICGLALTHTPREVQFYCLDFGGGTLAALANLPHVGSVTSRLDTDRVGRTVTEVVNLVAARERSFAALGIDSIATYRRMRADGAVTDDPYGDVFLVVDGWFTLRQDFEKAETAIREIAARGLNFGIHIVLTAARWSEVYHGMRDQIGTRLELRLGDPVDSAIDMRTAATVPSVAGRGITSDKLHFLGAVPRIDGDSGPVDLTDGVRALVETVNECWSGPTAPRVRTLPAIVPLTQLPPPEGDLRVAVGLDEDGLRPVWHDFAEVPHLTILGDNETGKTNLLRLLAQAITTRYTPEQARIMVVNYRRELFDDIPADFRLGYSVSPDATRETVADAVLGLKARVPGADITAERLRRRDWWTGPTLFILVDDYDMLSGHDSPLQPLVPLVQHGADIGMHLVLTRGAAGAMRMAMDPLLRRLQETNSPDIALSCPPSEGPLIGGVKPRVLPPGRALLCTRRSSRLIHTALCPAAAPLTVAT
ncbi:type VII secretion protein EccCa [Dactylosporangium sp. NBC_01737]|uniref:type VII secretion protein EccCa n=1 Tax=Dactylosporangium sp. NBC_01737 TaxID=2975959 RepID=UPI002E0E43C4|nr:type VII secretion protein EccCa [Dactylosporangium sp. NBC_01737]